MPETSHSTHTGPHPRLTGKAKQATRVAERIAHTLSSPEADKAALAALLSQLRPALNSLHKSTLEHNGPHAELVASAINDAIGAFEKLVRARQTTDIQTAVALMVGAQKDLAEAKRKAHRAGDAWPL
jgi:hypothetical protein